MRAVTTATAAAAIGVSVKALDNLLTRIDLPEALSGRQGVERRIPVSLLPELLLSTEIAQKLDIPVKSAFAIARRLVAGTLDLRPILRLQADLPAVRSEVDEHLELAIETVVRRRRGRPRSSAGS